VGVQGRLLEVNEAYCRMSGYSESQLLTMHISDLEAVENPGETAAHMKTIMAKGADRFESRHRRKDGSIFEVEVNVQQLSTGNDRLVVFVQDTTKRKAAESQIQSLAFSDPLTALPNRRLLLDRLQQALAGSGRQQRQGALMLVDLDNFKDINDVLGHAQGDLVLQHVAKRLGACVRERDTVARVGADEFAVLLADLDENPLEAAMQAETVAHKILDALKQPYQLDGSEVSCTGSIGIALFGEHNDVSVEALKRAEMAMYQAKTQGRNTLRFFDPKMQAVVNARVSMESSLRDAVAHDRLELHYQAQVTDQGQITGAEALLRWLDPKRGVVSPAEFIPMAEETGLILPIGNWVIETACKQLAQWASQPGMAHLTVAVNVSAKQFHQRDFVDRVLMTLERTGANPHRLKLELTESLLVADVEGVIVKMNALKAGGVTFSLDDFGTGYSSLSYLQRLPLDQLKIDQGFIRDILINPNDAAIAKMVVALADSLGLTVIPEGVETEAQREFLVNLGCRHFQGYLFSRPLPIQEFEAFAMRS
jgi:diguanylate cyclase (GGDEF)-like protein/PAS domain S-box-containing protein